MFQPILKDYIVSPSPSPFPLDFGFWIWDLDLGLGFGTGLGLDNFGTYLPKNVKSQHSLLVTGCIATLCPAPECDWCRFPQASHCPQMVSPGQMSGQCRHTSPAPQLRVLLKVSSVCFLPWISLLIVQLDKY